ncbi:MAG: hypothetical protein U0414_22455 [Polyangiaceae bacterium]
MAPPIQPFTLSHFGAGPVPGPLRAWRAALCRFAVDGLAELEELDHDSPDRERLEAAYQLLHVVHMLTDASNDTVASVIEARDLLRKHREELRLGFVSAPPALGQVRTEWLEKVKTFVVRTKVWDPEYTANQLAQFLAHSLRGTRYRERFGTLTDIQAQLLGVLSRGQSDVTTDRLGEPLGVEKVSAKLLAAILKRPWRPSEAFGDAARKAEERAENRSHGVNKDAGRARKRVGPDKRRK